jgi:drug/metabolite transporter (DMT)-like permease
MRALPPLAVAGLLTNATVWGLSWIVFKGLQAQGLHPLWTTAVIYGASALLLMVFKAATLRLFMLHAGLWGIVIGSGMTNACFNTALAVGEPVRVVLLFYLMPIWAVLLARILLHEPITPRALARIALGLIGAFTVLWEPQLGIPYPRHTADWLAIAGGFFFALNNVMLRKLNEVDEWARAIAMFGGGALLALAGALLLNSVGLIGGLPVFSSYIAWMLALWAALFLMGNLALQYGAGRLPANITAVIMLSEILVVAVSSWLFAQSQIRAQDIIGGLIIIAAPWIIQDRATPAGSNARANA